MKPVRYLRGLRRELIARTLERRGETGGHVSMEEFGIDDPEYHEYEPSGWRTLNQALRGLEIGPEDSFVDLGCGKGRVVQQAARRLGVSPVTIRRWTATGFLPCTRTAGGHRRIDEHDIDDLAKAIGGSNHLAAQLAREREVDVLVNTATALAVKLDLTELLLEIAMRMTSLLDCHFCAISEYDAEADATRTLAEYDHVGQRIPDASPYRLRDFPLTRTVLREQVTAVVNVDDPHADPAEVAELRREGDRSLLMVPLVVQGRSIGLLEVVDQKRW